MDKGAAAFYISLYRKQLELKKHTGGFLVPYELVGDLMEAIYPGFKFQELMRKAIKKGKDEQSTNS